jgi:ubiquinone/menaquinone biosynthesis C-methylase UbiE
VSHGESKFIERKSATARYAAGKRRTEESASPAAPPAEQLKEIQTHCSRVAKALASKCGVEFRGRILEIGAGGAWLSAELSKLTRVVEIVATDFEEEALREEAPRMFAWLKARADKITRTTMDEHQLDFPNSYFDFVIAVGALRHGMIVPLLLKECGRVLKPGGSLVAVPEPLHPLRKEKSRSRSSAAESKVHTVTECEALFTRAGFIVKVRELKLAGRWRYHYDRLVKGVVHARYAIVGTKPSRR